jgi:hypothetical protein
MPHNLIVLLFRMRAGKCRVCWVTATHGICNHTSWIHGEGLRWPCPDICQATLEKEKKTNEVSKHDNRGTVHPETNHSKVVGNTM